MDSTWMDPLARGVTVCAARTVVLDYHASWRWAGVLGVPTYLSPTAHIR